MKTTHKLRVGIRWFMLSVLLFALAGCTTMANFFGYDYDDETGGCTYNPKQSFFGCKYDPESPTGCFFGPAEDVGQFGAYDALRGPRRGTDISARDMGFGQDVPEYQAINKKQSSD